MYIPSPSYHNNYPFLEDLLRSGAKARISLGLGTNLRIIKVTKRNKTIAYGQYPHLAGALIHVEQDAKDKHPDLFPKDQYNNEKRPHFHHYSSGAKPRDWDDKDRLLYQLGMYYLMDIEISCKKRRFFVRPIKRDDVKETHSKKKMRFRVGKGSCIINAFFNLLTANTLPPKRRKKKTLDMIAAEKAAQQK